MCGNEVEVQALFRVRAPTVKTRSILHPAREANRDFGGGGSHPARLNFGDCFAYALAKAMHEPLLFKGNDFKYTEVIPALSGRR